MKRVLALASVLVLLLAGCTSQAEIDEAACRVFSTLTTKPDKDLQTYRNLLAQAEELSKTTEDEKSALAKEVFSVTKNLSPHFGNDFDGFVLNIVDWKEEDPAAYEDLREAYYEVYFACAEVQERSPNDLLAFLKYAERDSDPCKNSMFLASTTTDSTLAEKHIRDTTSNCESASEWYEALKEYPYAMGFPDVAGNELEFVCFNYPNSQVCVNP